MSRPLDPCGPSVPLIGKPDYEAIRAAHDPVHRPAHYTAGRIESIEAIGEALGLDGFVAYCRGNAMKYLWRAGKKDATAQELRKAAWYCERAAMALETFGEASR